MTPYRHDCGLLQHNISIEKGFSALIVVKTPALDDSGVSHAVEHLIFRRNAEFDQAESLFQLTALTDLSINASTHCDKTYYHCHSQSRTTCLLGLNYLLNGLLAPVFVAKDLRHEIYHSDCYGVLYRELSFQQVDKRRVVDRSDTSKKRCYQYGGDIELISQLTETDVSCYHAEYYQAHKMQLFTGNIESSSVASILNSINVADKASKAYVPKTLPNTQDYETDKQLLRWWIDSEFYTYFLDNYKSLSHSIDRYGCELMSPEFNLNAQQQFALDAITPVGCSEPALSAIMSDYVLKNPDQVDKQERASEHKFSSEIRQLIEYCRIVNSDTDANSACESNQKKIPMLGRAKAYPLQKQPKLKQQRSNKNLPLSLVENRIISPLLMLVSENDCKQSLYKHRPLPRLFSPLLREAEEMLKQSQNAIAEVFDQDHCLMLIRISKKEEYLGMLTSFIMNAYPTFLSSRTQGHCYAIASHYIADYNLLAFYSAFDVAPSMKLRIIEEAIKALSDDLCFISTCLPLAKLKLGKGELSSISVQSVAAFISHSVNTNDK